MKWTMDAPTKPGWYWWRESVRDPALAVEIYPCGRPDNPQFVAVINDVPDFVKNYITIAPLCQWSDSPIQEPEEKV